MALWLNEHLEAPSRQLMDVGDGTLNLLLSWGTPSVVFCTHMDTVPPYIAPVFPEGSDVSQTSLRDPSHAPGTCRLWTPPSYPAEGSQSFGDVTTLRNEPQTVEDVTDCHSDSSPGHSDSSPCHSERSEESKTITGRGSCDAKGQLFAMYTACKELEAKGCTGFGLLILAGEETGSWGAKAFSKTGFTAPFLIVGEPTDNKMVSAAKGTLSYDLKFTGREFHSGYPQCGTSAVELFNQFYNALKAVSWGIDLELGETTWNIGLLSSPNPQNILSPELTCRLYFRTTFLSHAAVQEWMQEISGQDGPLSVTPRGGDVPARYVVLPGFESAPVAFGSDAPHLTGFGHKIICGPGSIKVAHRPEECITVADLKTAVQQYVRMAVELKASKSGD